MAGRSLAAGLHRLFPYLEEMRESNVDAIVVVAGMEGALSTVVKGLVGVPVIGIPTSTGYVLMHLGGVGCILRYRLQQAQR